MHYWRTQLPATYPSPRTSPSGSQKSSTNIFELGVGGAQKRYWKRISTVLLVIVIACSLIALVVFISTPRAGSILSLRKILKKWLLEDSDTMTTTTKGSQTPATTTATARRFASARSSASNVRFSGKDTILFDDDGDLWRLSLHNMETRPLFRSFYTQIWANRGLDEHCPASAKRSTKICSDYKILSTHWHHGASPDLRFSALLKATSRKVHRKFNATYTFSIVNLEELSRITQEKVMNSSKKMPKRLVYKVGIKKTAKEAQRIFKWNSVGDDYIFWQDGHLYYSDTAESTTSIQISGGGPNWEHGIFDWVYEEEIFGRGSKAVWWSVKGQKLAFLSREKTKEKSVYLTSYYRHEKYPIVVELPYPKTHEERLPTYTINLWDKKTHELKRMDVQLRDSTIFHYLYGVKWIVMNDEELLVATWANRLQTHISVTICGHTAGICKLIFEHQYPSKTWAEPSDFASLLGTDDAIYMLLPRATADGNSYQHIAKLMIQMESSRSIKGLNWANMSFLSLGNFDVVNIESYDKGTDTIYFTASAPSPTNRHLYVTKGSPTTSDAWSCLTCAFSNCTYQSNEVSPDFKHILTSCEGPAPEHYYLSRISQRKLENTVEILRNDKYDPAATMLPLVISETFPLKQGYEARVKILLPPGQQSRYGTRSLPVLVHVYAGPGPQMASDQFREGYTESLVTSRNFAVVSIDGRGSNGRGWNYRSAIYGALGTVEIDDQIQAIRQMMKKYPFLDDRRLFVFGWSYGGFAAALMAERAPEAFFKCAISVAPVANFLFYDATYTERYMGNADRAAYDAGDIATNVSNFKKTRLLLIHGMYDDNVHFQHSALFIEALQRNNIGFDLMVYPHGDHSMVPQRTHLYHKISSFLDRCVKKH